MKLRRLFSGIVTDEIDAVAIVSVIVLAIGTAMVFVPAAFIVVGILGLLYAIAASRRSETT